LVYIKYITTIAMIETVTIEVITGLPLIAKSMQTEAIKQTIAIRVNIM
jgi:hypothetical protein